MTDRAYAVKRHGAIEVLGDQRQVLDSWPDGELLVVERRKRTRTSRQNNRHWALMTIGAESLWEDRSLKDTLHDELAHLYFGLPPCPKTGLRRRRRTPKTDTVEFANFTMWCANKLTEYGADLTKWDDETRKVEAA